MKQMRSKKHPRKDQQAGFGMLGVLMAAAIGLVAVAGITESVLLMSRSQSSVEMTRQSLMIADQIDAALANGTICTKMLIGGLPPITLPSAATPNQIAISLPINGSPTMIGRGLSVTPQLNVVDFSWSLDTATTGLPFIVIDPSGNEIRFTRFKIDLTFQTKKNASGLFAPVSYPHKTKIQVVVDGTNTFKSCIAESELTKACEVSGGVWNPDPSPTAGPQCIPYSFSDWGGAFTPNGPADPGGFYNQLTNAASCPSGYTKKQSGAVATAYRQGKYHIGNKMTPIYTCMRFGRPPGTDVPIASDVSAGADAVLTDSNNTADANTVNARTVRGAFCATGSPMCGSIP